MDYWGAKGYVGPPSQIIGGPAPLAPPLPTPMRGSITASLIGYVLLMHVKEFGQLLIGISSLLEKISRGLYYERMKLSYHCTAEYKKAISGKHWILLSTPFCAVSNKQISSWCKLHTFRPYNIRDRANVHHSLQGIDGFSPELPVCSRTMN